MTFRQARANEQARLFEIWHEAVRATHDFLSAQDRAEIAEAVKNEYLPNANLLVYVDGNDRALGFMGCTGRNIDALFIHPDCHGQGIGRRFIDRMKADHDHLTVQVNEQQPEAHAFYRRCGFRDTHRDAVDDAGRPFPIIHMEWRR